MISLGSLRVQPFSYPIPDTVSYKNSIFENFSRVDIMSLVCANIEFNRPVHTKQKIVKKKEHGPHQYTMYIIQQMILWHLHMN